MPITLHLFGDESADETKQRVFAIAGLVGTNDEWQVAEKAWLKRTGGKIFHAAECESEYATDPDPAKHKENLALYKDLTEILANGYVAGICMALDLASFRACFPAAPADAPYFKCLSDLLTAFGNLTREHNVKSDSAREFDEVRIDFTLDDRRESAHQAGELYKAFINQPDWVENNAWLGATLSFDTRRNSRIQISDLVAREAMKELDRKVGLVRRDPRKSWLALEQSGRFKFQERDRAYFERARAMMPQLQAETGMTDESYSRWLFETGRFQNGRPHDTIANRIEYFALLDRKGRS
jgi:hypothetical protein